MNIDSDFDYLIRLVLLGDSTVGKTNLVLRFTENVFSDNSLPTLGQDFKSKLITLKSKKTAKINIWDTGGQERYMSINKSIYQKVDGVMLVYDITNRETFTNTENWIKEIKEFNHNMPIMLVGNKADLNNERIVEYEEGKKYADDNKLKFIEVSALNGENVDKAFIEFGNDIFSFLKKKLNSDSVSLESSKKGKRKKKCC